MRNLILALGDQLDQQSAAFDGFDPSLDAVWMAEAPSESEYVWSHKARIAVFLSAMRHFRDALRKRGATVHYRELDDPGNLGDFASELARSVRELRPERLVVVEPGEHRVAEELTGAASRASIPLQVRPDRHFLCSRDEFAEHADGRNQLRMEFFYRELRRRSGVLMSGGKPIGGRWNYDSENRGSFGKQGPGEVPPPRGFRPDATTKQVTTLVIERFGDHPGSLERFDWPVTPRQASAALADFVEHRLPRFGQYQDALWSGQPHLYHSRLSAAMNLKLLDPRKVIEAACEALDEGHAPIEAVEGFVRQVLGWREYVRGVYWRFMPDYGSMNHFGAGLPLPWFYWTGETEMNCLREVIGQTLEYGYAHHIQRLMVTGLFALLVGVAPLEVHRWYLAVYVDAVEWVEMPNVLGMSQFADGGLMASKPYIATGKYIDRMSNYCADCRYRPSEATGDEACPFTTLYWDFLHRHRDLLSEIPRMVLQVRNVDRLSEAECQTIREQASRLRAQATGHS
jgi:deoxyribodipyrimidine photolyase-related protein